MTDKMLRPPEVMAYTGLSRTTLWRRVRAGTFPPPTELGASAIA
jgi:prophage regulatory protein